MNVRKLAAYAVLSSALSCSAPARESAAVTQKRQLTEGEAARVGSERVAVETVSGIARAQGATPSVARERAIDDALLALGAREVFAGHSLPVVLERAALARALLEVFKTDAETRGPPSDAEIAELSAARWQDFERPETVRATHAVALVDSPQLEPQAKAVAQQIWEAVRSIHDPEEFMRAAQAVPHEGVQVRAERLPAMTRDGRGYYPDTPPPPGAADQRFDEVFAAAVHQLKAGEVSPVVKTVFGYHVILCEARLPGLNVPLEQRRVLLRDEVLKGRAERSKQELLSRLTSNTPVLIARAAEDLTARVQVRE